MGGTSDPYIIFSGSACPSEEKGKMVEKTINPVLLIPLFRTEDENGPF
jgi:hypothetical protein